MRMRLWAALFALVGMLGTYGVTHAPAIAAPVTVSFDNLTAGTLLGSQYQSAGIIFAASPSSLGGASVNRVIAVKGGAHSGSNGIQLAEACGVEVYRNQLWARFASLQQDVSMYVKDLQASTELVTMEAVSIGGGVLASASIKTSGNWAPLSISRPQADIAFIRVSGPPSQGCAVLDDLSFGSAAGGSGGGGTGPDFALDFYGLDIGTQPGHTGSGTVVLNRFGGSSGRIDVTVSGFPPGTSGTITPFQSSGNALASNLLLQVTAQSNAPAALDAPIIVYARAVDPSAGNPAVTRSVVIPVTVASNYSLLAKGIEVTQGIQGLKMPYRDLAQPAYGTMARPLTYGGVQLTAGRKTIARVFITTFGLSTPINPNVALYGYDSGGKLLPGPNPISPENVPYTTSSKTGGLLTISYAERVDGAGTPAEFTLPDAWTPGTITLRAVVTPPQQQSFDTPTDAACDTQACLQLEEVAVSQIAFHVARFVTIAPVIANLTGYLPGPPESVFAPVFNVYPLEMGTWPYLGDIEMIDIYNDSSKNRSDKASAALDRIEDWDEDNGSPGDFVVGITSGIPKDSDIGMEDGDNIFSGRPYAVVNQTRSLTSVAHETGHAFGRHHASGDCGASNTKNGQYENWPYDQSVDKGTGGDLDSIGIDVSSQAPHTIKAASTVAGKPVWHDFMSYCAAPIDNGVVIVDSAPVWISAKGWGEISTTYLQQARALAKRTNLFRVRGYIDDGKAVITHVGPVAGAAAQRVGTAASPYHVRFLAANGTVLSDVPLVTQQRHLDPSPQSPQGEGVTAFTAVVPRTNANALEITQNGRTLIRRVRPAVAPTLRLIPQRRPMIAASAASPNAKTTIAWVSRSATATALASVDVSTDGGTTWRTIYVGPDKGTAAIPSMLFPDSATGAARIRVRINDGFNETSTISGPLTTVGAPPFVHIFEPRNNVRARSDAGLYLRGSAMDNAGHAIALGALTWAVDGRVFAHGTLATALGLAPGAHRISFSARDARGRQSSANANVTIVAVRPLFTQLAPPASIATTARSITLTAATTVPATLRAGGLTFALNRAPRRITIPVTPGHGPAMIPLRLEANGSVSASTLLVRRRPLLLRPLVPAR